MLSVARTCGRGCWNSRYQAGIDEGIDYVDDLDERLVLDDETSTECKFLLLVKETMGSCPVLHAMLGLMRMIADQDDGVR